MTPPSPFKHAFPLWIQISMTVLGIHAKTAGHVQIWLMTTAVPACQVTLERTVITVSQNMQLSAKPGAPDDRGTNKFHKKKPLKIRYSP